MSAAPPTFVGWTQQFTQMHIAQTLVVEIYLLWFDSKELQL